MNDASDVNTLPGTGAPPPPPNEPPAPPPRKRRRARGLLWVLLLVPALVGLGLLALTWALKTDDGSGFVLARVPGLTLTNAKGSLLGDFSADRAELALGGKDRIVMEQLHWRGLGVAWSKSPLLWGELRARELRIARLRVELAPSATPSTKPVQPPADLGLPVAVVIDRLEVGEIYAPGFEQQPLKGLLASVALSDEEGVRHRVDLQSLQWQQYRLSGQARIGIRDAMELASQLQLSQPEGDLPWSATVNLNGPLRRLDLAGQLQAARQQLEVKAGLRPFDSFPLATLNLQAKDLDLQALLPQAPRTGLTGSIQLDPAANNTLALKAQLANSAAGRLDQQRLPVQQLALDLGLDPAHWNRLNLKQLNARLSGNGQLSASGQTSPQSGTQLTVKLAGLDSRQIDARWPVLQARGELRASTRASLEQASSADAALKDPLQLQGELSGQLGQGQWQSPLTMELRAQLHPQSLQLQQLKATSGGANLQAQGELTLREALSLAGGWQLRADASVQGLDPRRFASLSSAGQAAPAKSTASAAKATAPATATPPRGAVPLIAGLLNAKLQAKLDARPGQLWPQGEATLDIPPSQWAGLPLQGQVNYRRQGNTAPDIQADLQLADASLKARSRVAAGPRSGDDQVDVQADLAAPRLLNLQALLRPYWPAAVMQGGLQAQFNLQLLQPAPVRGRAADPVFSTTGRWQVQGLVLSGLPGLMAQGGQPALRLDSGNGQWAVSSQRDEKLLWTTTLRSLRVMQGVRLDQAQLELQGSWAQHQFKLDTQGQLPLPAVLTAADPVPRSQIIARSAAASAADVGRVISSASNTGTAPGTPVPAAAPPTSALTLQGARIAVALQGALDTAPLTAWRQGANWQLRDLSLLLQPLQRKEPLVKAGPLALNLALGAGGVPQRAQAAPGRVEILNAAMRWDRLDWQGAQDWDIKLTLDPLSVAPLLARLQPDFGWGGDLQMDGHLNTRRDARGLHVDMALTRSRGDLNVTDEVGIQQLGLTDLRLGVNADDGIWHLTQGIAGRNLGAVGGALSARAADANALPGRDAKLQGVLEARVANVGNWGAWVPAGWRLGGSLFASLSVDGTLGAPQLHGRAGGQNLSLRNPLMGVDMTQGELALVMEGTRAQLERLVAKAGGGQVSASGQLHFGADPRAEVQLKADKFALLQRVDRRIIASGEATLNASAALLDLKGRFGVDEGLFDFSRGDAPTLDSDVEVVREHTPVKTVDGSRALRTKLDLDLDLGRRLRLKGYGIDTRLSGQLKLAQDGQAAPTLVGQVTTVGGTYNAYGQKLEVEKGLINFVGPLGNPRLDILAIRPGLDEVRVGVSITGTALSPRVKLYSDPEMAESAKLSWLVLGRSPDNLGRSDTLLMQRAAMALLSGDGESRSDQIIRRIGLDELSFSGDGDDARGTVVRLGKQISRNVFVAYERGLNATTGNWQLIYKLAQRFTLRAQAGEDQGLDLIWQWKWE